MYEGGDNEAEITVAAGRVDCKIFNEVVAAPSWPDLLRGSLMDSRLHRNDAVLYQVLY